MRRRKLTRLLSTVLTVAMLVSTVPAGQSSAAAKATLKTKKIIVYKGQTKKIVVKNKKKKRKYVFSSSKKNIATVSSKGVVKGKKAGKAVITVKEKNAAKKKKSKRIGKVTVIVKNKKQTQPSGGKTTTQAPAPSAGSTVQQSSVPTAAGTVTPEASATLQITPTFPVETSHPKPTATPYVEPFKDDDTDAQFYVASTGNDSADGSKEHPFLTLSRAKEAVRNCDKTKGDIVVLIANGFYPVKDTIEFSSKDSGTEDCTIHYRAAKGAKPVFSGGEKLDTDWKVAYDVNWLADGLKAYRTPLKRNKKLRAIYVNGKRASMTSKRKKPKSGYGKVSIKKGQADWAWNNSDKSKKYYEGAIFAPAFLPADTRNPQNIELESGSTWAKQLVCAQSLSKNEDGNTQVALQMPYGALAQNLGWNTEYSPTKANDVSNVFEWLKNPGEFYYDQAGEMLYYIPNKDEDIYAAEVVIPETDTLVNVEGEKPKEDYVHDISFEGLSFAYTDWNLYELEGSHGYASVQGSIVLTKFGNVNQHDDIYRSYDIPPAAIHVTSAKKVKFLDGEIKQTGYLGIHLENDVSDCEVTGNYIGQTGGAGIVVGHPTHVYENDTAIHQVNNNSAGPDKEKFKNGTEAVPKNITLTNNYLLENCYFFPGNSPITSFFTYNLQVRHNFVYKCSYSGMSIGWGWCNFDGEQGADSQLPGVPTTTSKNNHVNYNRVEEICSLLQDAGGIYTLGCQGNTDWTEYSEMSYNYINAKRKKQVANGSKMINGFHPDEGSAYIKFDGNVVTNIIRNVYELNDWRRKHDMIVTNGFSNTDRSETTAPNCSLQQYVNADCIWPLNGYKTVLYSGLEDRYTYMIGKDVIPDTDYELVSNVRLAAGQELPRRGLLKKTDEVWLAKEGTTDFVEGTTMTKAAGNEKSMVVPSAPGQYKLYIRYEDGTLSKASTFTLYVGDNTDIANVSDGQENTVSKKKPLKLQLDDKKYTYTLNGNDVTDGYEISKAGTWTLKGVDKESKKTTTIVFSTVVTLANQLLEQDITTGIGGEITFANPLSESGYTIWLAPSGLSAFDDKDPTMSKASGNSASMKAPVQAGKYILTVVGSEGEILSQSDAFVTVE